VVSAACIGPSIWAALAEIGVERFQYQWQDGR
jgi:hypothetical protein